MQVVAVGEGMSVIGLRARASPQDGGWWGEEWMSDRGSLSSHPKTRTSLAYANAILL